MMSHDSSMFKLLFLVGIRGYESQLDGVISKLFTSDSTSPKKSLVKRSRECVSAGGCSTEGETKYTRETQRERRMEKRDNFLIHFVHLSVTLCVYIRGYRMR